MSPNYLSIGHDDPENSLCWLYCPERQDIVTNRDLFRPADDSFHGDLNVCGKGFTHGRISIKSRKISLNPGCGDTKAAIKILKMDYPGFRIYEY